MSLNLPSLENQESILDQIKELVALKAVEVSASLDPDTLTLKQIQKIVQLGYASKVFAVGQQLTVNYTYNGTVYEMPFDIVHFDDVELEDGETVPGMFLQSHYATVESMMFDGYEAFYVATDGLYAGTYNVTMGNSWGTYVVSGTTYQFTLTEDVPAGGVLAGFRRLAYDVSDVTKLYVYSYESLDAGYSNYIEAAAISEGSGGTSLGTLYGNSSAADSGLNHMHRVMYGYNRWSQSGYRQWLNSSAAAGSWWTPQNDYDLPPEQYATYPGFLAGFEDDFLNILGTIKVTTALNTVEGLSDTSEDTYDKFFLPSLEQIYVKPQLSGVEGDYWEYWKRACALTDPEAQYTTDANRITYALNNKTSAQTVRLRSAYRNYASNTWIVNYTGYVNYNGAIYAYRCAPACVIC